MRLTMTLAALASLSSAIPARAEPITTETARAAVEKAIDELKTHNPAGVLPLVEPVVASLQDQQSEKPALCATGLTQAILLSTMQDALLKKQAKERPNDKPQSATVIDNAFCIAPFLKGFALIDLQRWDEAEPMLRLASESAPLDAQFRNEYAESFKAMKQWQKAHDVFAEAYDLCEWESDEDVKKSNQARALRGMGFVEIEMGDLDKAEKSFKKSLKIVPDHAGAKSELQYIADLRKKGTS